MSQTIRRSHARATSASATAIFSVGCLSGSWGPVSLPVSPHYAYGYGHWPKAMPLVSEVASVGAGHAAYGGAMAAPRLAKGLQIRFRLS